MKALRVGIIGCGGRGWAPATGYKAAGDRVVLAACADIHKPAAQRFKDNFGFKKIYTDYHEMLEKEKLDVVSMCLWPKLHCPVVLDIASAAYTPKLINAEKPMGPTYGEALKMYKACESRGIKMTFCHQRRYGASWSTAKKLLGEGVIGKLTRMEMNTSNLFDWGTHWFDMMNFFNDDIQASWVLGNIGCAADIILGNIAHQLAAARALRSGAGPGRTMRTVSPSSYMVAVSMSSSSVQRMPYAPTSSACSNKARFLSAASWGCFSKSLAMSKLFTAPS